jgi:hypothetical protein
VCDGMGANPDSVKDIIGFDLSTGEIPANFK